MHGTLHPDRIAPVRFDPADWFAAVASAPLPSRRQPVAPVLVPAPFGRRVGALLADAGVLLVGGTWLAFGVTDAVWSSTSAGPPFDFADLDNFGASLLLSTWCAAALAYTAVEAFGGRTVGKVVAGLRLVRPAGVPRRRLVLRWLLAYLPLLGMTLTFAVEAAWRGWQAVCYGPFIDATEWESDRRMFLRVAALLVLWAAGFLAAAGPSQKTVAERVSGVELLHAPPREEQKRRQGFDVVLPRTE